MPRSVVLLVIVVVLAGACGSTPTSPSAVGPSTPHVTMAVVVVDGVLHPLADIPVTFDPRYPIPDRIKQTDADGTVSWLVPKGEPYTVIVDGITRFGAIPVMGDCRWLIIVPNRRAPTDGGV